MDSLFNFLKRTGIGLLYIIGSPVIAFGFALFSLYGTLIFVFTFIQSGFLWVNGHGFFSTFQEDIRAETKYRDYLKQNPPVHKQNPPASAAEGGQSL
jgi:hypothetical protein